MSDRSAQPAQNHEHAGLRLTVNRDHAGAVSIELRRIKSTGRRPHAAQAFFAIAASLLAVTVIFAQDSAIQIQLRAWHEHFQGRLSSPTLLVMSVLMLILACVWPGPIIGERILVLRDLGLQHGVIRSNPLLRTAAFMFGLSDDFGVATRSLLIPRDEVMDVVVHEAFSRWTVRTYIAVLLARCDEKRFDLTSAQQGSGSKASLSQFTLQPGGQGGVIVLFPHLRPRLKLVQIAYTEIHRTLF